KYGHPERGFRDLSDTRADIAEPNDADRLAEQLGPHIAKPLDTALLPNRPVGLHDLLREGEHKAHGVFGDGLLVGAGLVTNQDAGLVAGIDVNHVVSGA